MRHFTSIVAVTLIVLSLVLTGRATTVQAEAPSNDDLASPILLGFPDTMSTNTTEATTGPEDDGACGSSHSVWYAFAGIGGDVEVNTIGSTYDTTLTVYADFGGGLQWVGCNDDWYGLQSRVSFFAESGATYYFMVQDLASYGGNLTISTLSPPPPPPPPTPFSFELTIDPTAPVNAKTGLVTIHGSIACVAEGYVWVHLELQQKAGRVWVRSSGNVDGIYCDGTGPLNWSMQLQGVNGIYKAGSGSISGYADGSGINSSEGYWFIPVDSVSIRMTGQR
jgi:hypothetical protein